MLRPDNGEVRLDELRFPKQRASVFTGSTRNLLVVLALALSPPSALSLAPLAVVTRTLVGMIVFVRLIPRLFPHRN